MSDIWELLKNEKVEWKELGEVCEFINGFAFKQGDFVDEGTPIIKIGDISKGKIVYDNVKYINENNYILDKVEIKYGDIVIAMSGATTGKIGYNYSEKKAYINQRVGKFIVKSKLLNNKFLYYFLVKNEKNFYRLASGSGSQPNLNKEEILKIKIPIPSLETQKKIVEILDNFTKYITELQDELQARNKQYQYYRDMLLSEEYLNKLSQKLDIHPNQEYKLRYTTLGEIGQFTRGNGLQKSDFREKGRPVIHYGQIYTKYGFETNITYSFTDEEIFNKLRKARPKDILIATTSENIEDVGKCVVWNGEEEIGFSGDMYSYSTLENSKYIAYFFQIVNFQKQKERVLSGTKVIRLHSDNMEKIKIVLPPLKIQNKVVEILDRFQNLLSETNGLLPKEIEQRQKQYEYYREKLLTFGMNLANTHTIDSLYFTILEEAAAIVGVILYGVEWKKLDEVMVIKNGKDWKSLNKGNIPVYGSGGEMGIFVDQYSYNKSTVLIPRKGSIENIFYVEKPFWNVDTIFYTEINEKKIIPKYFYYYISKYELVKLSEASTRPSLTQEKLNKIQIPLPSLQVQEYIVSKLDKFDTLINDISQGLPREIELRQKQYEYYREKLLSFSKEE